MPSGSDEEFLQRVTQLSSLFDDLCQQSHLQGEIDEGALHFFKDDQLETLLGELVTVANTARYAFINLALAQDYLRNTPLGRKAFTKAKDNWKGNNHEAGPNSAN